ncbi:MAG: DUF4055 domain-containing protein [Pseudoxanthomonas sp.]|nr:MAG: DUF4055 domain-containing protein [Pseudoxanthomonas sp.]
MSVMAGKPFSKALTLSDADARIEGWAENIDLQGNSLHVFAADGFREAVGYGLGGILVDYPRASSGGRRTVAQVEAAGERPYWVRYRHNQILGWKTESRNGAVILKQLRLLESFEEDDGPYHVKHVAQVRVLYPGRWEVWRQTEENNGKAAWVLADSGTNTLPYIPFVPTYGQRVAFMVGEPPLLDLAYLNVKHWQSQSDQDNIVNVARVPILVIYGGNDETELTVGSSAAMKMPPTTAGAEVRYAEHTGSAISAGAESLKDLEQQMIQSGAELLVKKPGDRSATESANDAEGNKSDLQRMAENYEDALDQALMFTAAYARLAKPGSVKLYDGYGEATLGDASATLIKDLWQSGLISRETAVAEFQRRGELAPEVDALVEKAKVDEEGPPLGMMGQADPNADPMAA